MLGLQFPTYPLPVLLPLSQVLAAWGVTLQPAAWDPGKEWSRDTRGNHGDLKHSLLKIVPIAYWKLTIMKKASQ